MFHALRSGTARVSARLTLLAALLAMPVGIGSASADTLCMGTATVRAKETLLLSAARLRQGQPLRILAIGSSSTQGAGATDASRSYPARLGALLNERLGGSGANVTNAGIGGETAEQTIERLKALLRSGTYDLVLWQVGTNDAVRGVDEDGFRQRLVAGIEAVGAAGADLMLIDQQFFPIIRDPDRYERFVAILAQTAAAHDVPVFQRYRAMKAWSAVDDGQFRTMLSADSFHMSDRGYACLASLLSDEIVALRGTPTLARRPAPPVAARVAPLP